MSHEELAAVAEALRIATRADQGLPPELASDEPFQLVAALIRQSEEASSDAA